MRCPTLGELPAPPPGKVGWPWTEESPQLPDNMPNGSRWPRVSIVTPSYNQAQFIEETIRSVLLQGYPDLEYIIIDGGSTDGSVEIIRKYERWLTYWVSEPDRGQSHALNKGFARATGSIVAWINSDDWYESGVVPRHAAHLMSHPEAVMVYSGCHFTDEAGTKMGAWESRAVSAVDLLVDGNQIPQPTVFMHADALTAVGGLDESVRFVFDYILWVKLGLIGEIQGVPGFAANFRHHDTSKSVTDGYKFMLEQLAFVEQWSPLRDVLTKQQVEECVRRLRLRTGLEFVFARDPENAADYFSLALDDGVWPYGGLDQCSQLLASAQGLNGQPIYGSREMFAVLGRALTLARPHSMSRPLWRRALSVYHMRNAFGLYAPHEARLIRSSLLQGVQNDPRWLCNLGVISMLVHGLTPSWLWGGRSVRRRGDVS